MKRKIMALDVGDKTIGGGLADDVEHHQADHDADHVDRGAHGPLGGEQAEAAGDGDAGDDREQDRLAGGDKIALSELDLGDCQAL